MKNTRQNKTRIYLLFLGKSLIWSALIYTTLMLLFNWEDIIAFTRHNPASLTANIDSVSTAKISANGSVIYTILSYIYCYFVS